MSAVEPLDTSVIQDRPGQHQVTLTPLQDRALWLDITLGEPTPVGDNGSVELDILLVPCDDDGERNYKRTTKIGRVRVSRFGKLEVVA